jgi:predicted 2-oxoglutarate/Fe(II)-dependent dioxygenase YbiX
VNADFFAHFGIFVRRHFLSRDVCRALIADAARASSRPASVRDGGVQSVDARYRSTRIADVSDRSVALVRGQVLALQPELERHFQRTTVACRTPEFLVYRAGDFFAPHADSIAAGSTADVVVTDRRISVVVFLNGESQSLTDGGYTGGTLDFYGLLDDPRTKDRPFPLTGEEGLLVAFRPETVHGVAPVVDGERFTVVTWFEGDHKSV